MTVRVPRELTERDPQVLAQWVGLEYVHDDAEGLRRELDGDAFRYIDASGGSADATSTARIEAMAIPPAWTEVWISPVPQGHLQATGHDDAGRKQYLYHPEFRESAETRKFDRLRYFGRAIVLIRKEIELCLERPLGDRSRAIAAAVRLIDEHLLRVGNPESAKRGHYGATTLTVDHIDDHGHVQLEYVGKSGKDRIIIVEDDDLADILVELADDADNELFWFSDGSDGSRRATASDVNRFVVECAGPAFSARDFRTWGGSRLAMEARSAGAGLSEAVDHAAESLGNTRAVARSSYVHPAIMDASQSNIDDVWRRSRSSKWFHRSESAMLKLLTGG